MRYPSLTQSSAGLFWGPGRYHHARVNAVPELRPLADVFRPAQERLRRRYLETEEAGGEVTMARAIRDEAESVLLNAVRSTSLRLLAAAGHSRRASLYTTYFPRGATEEIRRPRAQRRDRIERLLAKLEEEPIEAIADQVAELGSAYSRFLGTEEALRSARKAYREARAREETEKVAWLQAYRASFARLTLHFVGDPRRVEEFFIRNHRGGHLVDEENEEETESGKAPPSGGGAGVGRSIAESRVAGAARSAAEAASRPAEIPVPTGVGFEAAAREAAGAKAGACFRSDQSLRRTTRKTRLAGPEPARPLSLQADGQLLAPWRAGSSTSSTTAIGFRQVSIMIEDLKSGAESTAPGYSRLSAPQSHLLDRAPPGRSQARRGS